MKLTFLLGDAAQTDRNGKAHVLGLGWTTTATPLPPLALVFLIDAEPDEVGKQRTITVELYDEADEPVVLPDGTVFQVQVNFYFEPTDRAFLADGPIRMPVAVQVGAGMPLTPGRYRFRAHVDGEPDSAVHQTFQVRKSGKGPA